MGMIRKWWICVLFFFSIVFSADSKDRIIRWKLDSEPYRNYIYPQQTGLIYNLSYLYITESKAMRKYLKRHFDVRTSASVASIFRDVSTGAYFERYLECKIRYLKKTDTLVIRIAYENGEVVTEKYKGGQGGLNFNLHLTRYKNQHDFSTGLPKNEKKGLVTSVDMSVITTAKKRGYVMIRTKLYTEADMPGILTHIKGKNLFR